jgi:hypothetical protein
MDPLKNQNNNHRRESIIRAKSLLKDIHHPVVATVNLDGTPHNTPVFAAFDVRLNLYWASTRESVHSKNIARTGTAYIVLVDTKEGGTGLYFTAGIEELSGGPDLTRGHFAMTKLTDSLGLPFPHTIELTGDAHQRLYRARPTQLWVNFSTKDSLGRIVRDERVSITIQDLLV